MGNLTMTCPWAYKLPPGSQTSTMDPKERFYRQFQTSVTGKSSSLALSQPKYTDSS